MADLFLKNFKTYPKMVRWFDPVLLLKLLNNVATSALFGQYADRRLIVAALDTVTKEEHVARATRIKEELEPKEDGSVWIDFVADLGDGFDSTYAVATLLAKPVLQLPEQQTPLLRGQVLIMGGDEVYPLANEQTYRNQLWQPYSWASPDPNKKSDKGTPLFAIPGNHDWYDGLVMFLAFFAREKPMHFGSWRTRQRRSYFAIQITETWWLWAMDIQLAEDMDQPQADYFKHIVSADEMKPNSRIILCTAEPGWLYTDTNTKSWEIVEYAMGIARRANKDVTFPILLSGDTHHYSRYTASDGTQLITSGGGGAFLHPTHQLENDVSVGWVVGRKDLQLAKLNDILTASAAVYPSMATSKDLVWGNIMFAFRNADFALVMAALYTVVAVLIGVRNEPDTHLLILGLFAAGIISYTTSQEKVSLREITEVWLKRRHDREVVGAGEKTKLLKQFKKAAIVWSTSIAHVASHFWVATSIAEWAAAHGVAASSAYPDIWYWLGWLLITAGTTGFVAGSTIFGLNMFITCLWLRMNRNDAFSALRIGRFNNFVRMRIRGDEVELFAVGLNEVPERDAWESNPKYKIGDPSEPRWSCSVGLKPHLIERIIVKGSTTPFPRV